MKRVGGNNNNNNNNINIVADGQTEKTSAEPYYLFSYYDFTDTLLKRSMYNNISKFNSRFIQPSFDRSITAYLKGLTG